MRSLAWLVVLAACYTASSPPAPPPPASPPGAPPAHSQATQPPPSSSCGSLAKGRCYQRGDCPSRFDCVDNAPGTPPPPQVRATGMGGLYGTDGAACDRRPVQCPPGQTANPAVAPNLCPIDECRPSCTASSCPAGEYCDAGRCRFLECTQGTWTCPADHYCQFGMRGGDRHGCAPSCPPPGYCQPIGEPVP